MNTYFDSFEFSVYEGLGDSEYDDEAVYDALDALSNEENQ